MSSRLIVRNIPKYITENQLKERFTKFGKVTDVKILFKGNVHRRFCFVGFKDVESAEKAKQYFHNTYIDTSKISVDFASTLNDEKLVEEKKKKLEKHLGEKAASRVESKTEKLKKFASDLGLDPEAALGKRTDEPTPLEAKPKPAAAPGVDSKRLYVYNFPFSITKEELRVVFEKFGKVSECIIPSDSEGKSKGFGYVSFEDENCAIKAFAELDNTIVFGRIMHIKPSEKSRRAAFEVEKAAAQPVKSEGSSYKKLKKEEFLKNLEDDASWNSLFLNPNTVMEYVAQEYGLTKLDLMNREVDNPAVKIALAETKIINETKDFLRENGVDISIFEGPRKGMVRSRTTLIVKNIPKDTSKNRLSELLNRYGFVNRLILPNNKSIAIAQFRNIDHASNAFEKLSGYSFQGVPLYLEYAPEKLLREEAPPEAEQPGDSEPLEEVAAAAPASEKLRLEEEEEETRTRTVFIKNLNFKTTEEAFMQFLRDNGFGAVKFIKIIFKNGKSCGYGFMEFNAVEEAEKSLRILNQKILDGHKLELSISRGAQKKQDTKRKEKLELQASNKIIIRNVDFAASKKELRELVRAFGELRAVRMPTKVTGEHRGYAFVEFSNADEAKNAYEALSHSHFYGRKLVLEYAKE